jgi:hypothetical protein
MEHETRETRGARGFSLIEVVIASTILFTIIAIAGKFILDSNNLLRTISTRSEAEVKVARVADAIARSFRNCSLASFKPWYSYGTATPPYYEQYNGSALSSIYLRNVVDYNGQSILGDAVQYHLAVNPGENYTNGIDDDKDGRTDEIEIQRYIFPASCFSTTTDPTEVPAWSGAVKYGTYAEIAYGYSAPASPSAPDWNQVGFNCTLNGAILTIKVKMPKYDPVVQKHVIISAESSVKLRN